MGSEQKICILGAGAMGTYFMAALAPSFETSVILRSSNDRPPAGTIRITGSRESCVARGRISVISPHALAGMPGAAIWICVKAHQLGEALESVRPHLASRSTVVIFSNGLGIHRRAKAILGEARPIVRVLCSFGAAKESPHEVRLSGEPSVVLAAEPRHTEAARETGALLAAIKSEVIFAPEIEKAEWSKALVNLTVNTICSAVNSPNRAIVEDALLKELAREILAEVRAVALAQGVDLSDVDPEEFFAGISRHGANVNSTLADLRLGKESELAHLTGEFLALAARSKVAAPRVGALHALLSFVEKNRVLAARK